MKYILIIIVAAFCLAACGKEEECVCTKDRLYCDEGECVLKPYIFDFGLNRAGSVQIKTAYTAIGPFDSMCADTVVAFVGGEAPYYDLKIHTEYTSGLRDIETQKTLMDDHLRIDSHYLAFCQLVYPEVSSFHARVYQDSIVLEMGVAPWPDVFDEINEVTLLSWELHKEKYDIDCPDC